MNTDKNVIYNNALHTLQYYMLTTERLKGSIESNAMPTSKTSVPTSMPTSKTSVPTIYIPNGVNDTLYWCYYIFKHGMHSFDMLQYKNIVIEKQQKIALVTTLRNNKHVSKKLKLDTLGNLEGNLGNDDFLTLATFFTLCAIEHIPVMYVNKNSYFMVNVDADAEPDVEEINVIEKRNIHPKKTVYGFKQITIEQQKRLTTTLYKLPSLHANPLKGISSYTLDELQTICNTLNIHITGKPFKKELYDTIVKTLINM